MLEPMCPKRPNSSYRRITRTNIADRTMRSQPEIPCFTRCPAPLPRPYLHARSRYFFRRDLAECFGPRSFHHPLHRHSRLCTPKERYHRRRFQRVSSGTFDGPVHSSERPRSQRTPPIAALNQDPSPSAGSARSAEDVPLPYRGRTHARAAEYHRWSPSTSHSQWRKTRNPRWCRQRENLLWATAPQLSWKEASGSAQVVVLSFFNPGLRMRSTTVGWGGRRSSENEVIWPRRARQNVARGLAPRDRSTYVQYDT